jgi:hypothetical protein
MDQEITKRECVQFFFGLRNNLYFYHLSTTKYARHVAVGDLVDTFDDLIDNFLEILFGKYDRPHNDFADMDIKVSLMNDAKALFRLQKYIDWLNTELPKLIPPSDSDLLNIRDEMVGKLNNSKYLFVLE